MNIRYLFAPIFIACGLAGGVLGTMSVTNTALAGPVSIKPSERGAKTYVVQVKKRGRRSRSKRQRKRQRVRIHLPFGPAYIYRDYPYYYSRGFYPTHIGGYVYYPNVPNFGDYSPRYRYRCPKGSRHCASKLKTKKRYRSTKRKRRK